MYCFQNDVVHLIGRIVHTSNDTDTSVEFLLILETKSVIFLCVMTQVRLQWPVVKLLVSTIIYHYVPKCCLTFNSNVEINFEYIFLHCFSNPHYSRCYTSQWTAM